MVGSGSPGAVAFMMAPFCRFTVTMVPSCRPTNSFRQRSSSAAALSSTPGAEAVEKMDASLPVS
jgi:hypothetical protein